MRRRLPTRDSVGAHRRKAVAARRVGVAARCRCGESRPEALIQGTDPIRCAACDRIATGRATVDNHHSSGRANSTMTIPIPVNDHRARLSVAQADWPKSTLRNVNSSPLLAGAACIRGFVDMLTYLIDALLPVAELLEKMDVFQVKKLGPRWWLRTEIEQFAPKKKKKSNARRS